jgi:hypothetical protein
MEIYAAERKKLANTVLSILDKYLGKNHYICHDSFYNNVKLAKTLSDKNTNVCGTMRANRGISCDLEKEVRGMKEGESSFQRKGDIMVQVWKDKRAVPMISTILYSGMVNTRRKDRKFNLEVSSTTDS